MGEDSGPGPDAGMDDAGPMDDGGGIDTGDGTDAGDVDAGDDMCDYLCDGECIEGYHPVHCGGCDITCEAFERCNVRGCDCDYDDEPLCGTYGRASYPVGAPNYQANGETVLDRRTNLIWQRYADDTRRTYFDARTYCDSLTIGGRDDWRLPGRIELVTILDATQTPSLDYDVFPDTPENYFWTQSRSQHSEGRVYSIYFGQGETVLSDEGMASAYTRCVATDEVVLPEDQVVVDEEYVEDANTNLRWDREAYTPSTFERAYEYCADKGARLPTLNEMQSLVDEAGYNPSIDRFLFPDTPYDVGFWTNTRRDLGEEAVWTVNFSRGLSDLEDVTEVRHVRCVRNR